MNFEFNYNTTKFLKIILENALKQNLRVFFVGGIVRDKILNKQTDDIDLLILGNAIEFAEKLPAEIEIKSIHKDFCTVKLFYNGISIDIASSRTEIYPFSGCLPVLKDVGVDLKFDVMRRDFSVNSLYCELKLENDKIVYELLDLVDGIQDLNNKTLKVLHNKSYIDDPTRIIRGVAFKYRFGFDFFEDDKKLIDNYMRNIDYSNMSIDRNLKVISHVLRSDYSDLIFKEIVEKKYYKIINPDDISVNFSLISKIISGFDFTNEEKADFYLQILKNTFVEKICFDKKTDIYKNYKKLKKTDLAYYYYKTNDDNVLIYQKIKDVKLNVSGSDLILLNYSQGKNIGIMLDELLDEKLQLPSKFPDKKSEIEWILKHFPIN